MATDFANVRHKPDEFWLLRQRGTTRMVAFALAVVILYSVCLVGAEYPFDQTWPPASLGLRSRSERSHGEEGIPRGLTAVVKKR